jgi:hypothetical protein
LAVITGCNGQSQWSDDPDRPPSWAIVSQAQAEFERAAVDALTMGAGYPSVEGEVMLRNMGWTCGQELVRRLMPEALQLELSLRTCRLLPEMTPVPERNQAAWLDTVLPVFRTVNRITRPVVRRVDEPSVAVIYQTEQDGIFETWAELLASELPELVLNIYPGTANMARGGSPLNEALFGHRALVFLGHLGRPYPGGEGGWMMTERDVLPLKDLKGQLGGRSSAGRGHDAMPVPELVLSGCCWGAWGDANPQGDPELFYPEVFLSSGVRFFVGSWTKVIVRYGSSGPRSSPDLRTLSRMFGHFLNLWAKSPDRTAAHLHEAKKEVGFPLLASLFQLYTTVEPNQQANVPAPAAPEPTGRAAVVEPPAGALLDQLTPNACLGEYRLLELLWRDPHASSFWAVSDRGPHILQVLADAWQNEIGMFGDLQKALDDLRAQSFPPTHLTPDRVEQLPLTSGAGSLNLVALVYDRNPGERPEQWVQLSQTHLDRSQNDHYRRVLRLGEQAACCLWEMHAKGFLHGNFDPACVVLHQASQTGEETVYIKDAWVQGVRPGRCTRDLYAAPEEPEQATGPSRLKRDCWGLGVVLYQLATGRDFEKVDISIREAVGGDADRVPEALDRVVRECLAPAASVRPAAEAVARRLRLALEMGGTYVEDIEEAFDLRIRAGQRLFVVRVEDIGEIERVLFGLQSHPRSDIHYHMYTAVEDLGITDQMITDRNAAIVQSWMTRDQVEAEAGAACTPPEVAARNGLEILKWVNSLKPPPKGRMPVLLIRGMDWWEGRDPKQAVQSWRVLKQLQREWGYPVLVVADSVIRTLGEVTDRFALFHFPPPPPSDLFEAVLAASRRFPGEELEPTEAAKISDRLFPCSRRELEELVRLCLLRKKSIWDVVGLRDEERARRFDGGVLSYLPAASLPPLDHVGWPPQMEQAVHKWVQVLRESGLGPRRVLVTGPAGYAITFAARALAGSLGVPLIRMELSRCLRAELGASEEVLRRELAAINNLRGIAVMLEGIDGLTFEPGAGGAVAGTMSRIGAILRDWLAAAPQSVIVLMTASRADLLPKGWERLFETRLDLEAHRLDAPTEDSMKYRISVFGALFRKFSLPELAGDADFLRRIAVATHPDQDLGGRGSVPAPFARLFPELGAGSLTVQLRDVSEIESWIVTTILHHTPGDDTDRPKSCEFWEEAVVPQPAPGRAGAPTRLGG